LTALESSLDPVALLARLRELQAALAALSDGVTLELVKEPAALSEFLAGLRIAWKSGETRPTAIAKAKPARYWRSRIDPFAAVAADLDRRFAAAPGSTGREIFEALQAEHPGMYADHLLRTFQRRIKLWLHTHAKSLVFGAVNRGPNPLDTVSLHLICLAPYRHEHAVVLVTVKAKPSVAVEPRPALTAPCARRRWGNWPG